MPSNTTPPWKTKNPAPGNTRKKLTDSQKFRARMRAEEAGRPYPNLIDNMWAAKQKP